MVEKSSIFHGESKSENVRAIQFSDFEQLSGGRAVRLRIVQNPNSFEARGPRGSVCVCVCSRQIN